MQGVWLRLFTCLDTLKTLLDDASPSIGGSKKPSHKTPGKEWSSVSPSCKEKEKPGSALEFYMVYWHRIISVYPPISTNIHHLCVFFRKVGGMMVWNSWNPTIPSSYLWRSWSFSRFIMKTHRKWMGKYGFALSWGMMGMVNGLNLRIWVDMVCLNLSQYGGSVYGKDGSFSISSSIQLS